MERTYPLSGLSRFSRLGWVPTLAAACLLASPTAATARHAIGLLERVVAATHNRLALQHVRLIGIARLSSNWLVSKIALTYVEIFRNTPVLVQLLVIYFVVFLQMPKVRESIQFPLDMYLSQRGFYLPRPEVAPAWLSPAAVRVTRLPIGLRHNCRGLARP